MSRVSILHSENLKLLQTFSSGWADLIYIDPPFNTGKAQQRGSSELKFADSFDDYVDGFLKPRLLEARRVLTATGSLFVHLDFREVHYVKVLLDTIFGRASFMNEIIWAYDYGGRSKSKWSAKHDNILWYAVDPKNYCFNFDAMDRIPYMAPGLVGPEKAARGKTPTDCWKVDSDCGDYWWHTIVPTNGKEKTGYPTQKPLGILERIVKVHSKPGDQLLDFFAGSGSFGEAALKNGRDCVLIDENLAAVEVMRKRFEKYPSKV